MIVTLPTKNGNIDFELDTSAYADYRFEVNFAKELQCTFQEFVQRIAKQKGNAKANYLSVLKILYCYLESDKAPTFISFIKLFDVNYAEEMLKKLTEVLEQSFKSAVKN